MKLIFDLENVRIRTGNRVVGNISINISPDEVPFVAVRPVIYTLTSPITEYKKKILIGF